MSFHAGAENEFPVLWKNSQCPSPLNPLSSTHPFSFVLDYPLMFSSMSPRNPLPSLHGPPPVLSCHTLQPAPDYSPVPYQSLFPQTGTPASCAVRSADCAAPVPSSQCASGPGKSQHLKRATWSNTRRPAARGRRAGQRGTSSAMGLPPHSCSTRTATSSRNSKAQAHKSVRGQKPVAVHVKRKKPRRVSKCCTINS